MRSCRAATIIPTLRLTILILIVARLSSRLSRHTDLLILDDWGPESLNADQRGDLLEIVEDRYNRGSVLITTQVPIGRWYEIIGNPTLADAILDRVIHNADLRWLAAGHTSSRPTAAACASRRRQ